MPQWPSVTCVVKPYMGTRTLLCLQYSTGLAKSWVPPFTWCQAACLQILNILQVKLEQSHPPASKAPNLPLPAARCCWQELAMLSTGRSHGSTDGRSDRGASTCSAPHFPAPSRCGSAASARQEPESTSSWAGAALVPQEGPAGS